MTKIQLAAILVSALVSGVCLGGCQREQKEPDCVEPPAQETTVKKKVSRKEIRKVSTIDKKRADWCRACVMGPKGWASCQVGYGDPGMSREEVRRLARDKACDDAGFEKGQCPDKAVLAIKCKGDTSKAPGRDPAKALQKQFFPGKGAAPEAPAKDAPAEGAPATENAEKKAPAS